MYTPQEMRDKQQFEKAVFGGYSMQDVDSYLTQLTEDYSALFKENAMLKSQQKVLVDRLEEYHKQEDSMNKAMIAAQQAADELVAETERRCARMLSDSEALLRKRKDELQEELDADARRVATARETASEFIGEVQLQVQRCQLQLDRIRATLGENTTVSVQSRQEPRTGREARNADPAIAPTLPTPVVPANPGTTEPAVSAAQIIADAMPAEAADVMTTAEEPLEQAGDTRQIPVVSDAVVQTATAPLDAGRPMPVGEAAKRDVQGISFDIDQSINSILEKVAAERATIANAKAQKTGQNVEIAADGAAAPANAEE